MVGDGLFFHGRTRFIPPVWYVSVDSRIAGTFVSKRPVEFWENSRGEVICLILSFCLLLRFKEIVTDLESTQNSSPVLKILQERIYGISILGFVQVLLIRGLLGPSQCSLRYPRTSTS